MRMIVGLDAPTSGRSPSTAAPTGTCASRCATSAPCSRPRPSTPGRSARDHLRWLADSNAHRPAPGRRGPRPGRPHRRRRPPLRRVLPRHGPAPRHRHRPARRPGHPAPRRTGQRPRPRGHPVDPPAAALPRRRGPLGPGLQPPHERDGADRRPAHRRRPGPPHRRGHRRRGRADAARPATSGSTAAEPERLRAPPRRAAVPTCDRDADGALDRHRHGRPRRSASSPAAAGITLYELSPQSASLEEAFMELTRDAAEYTRPEEQRHDRHHHPHRHRRSAPTRARTVLRCQRPSRVDQAPLGPLDGLDPARHRRPRHRLRRPHRRLPDEQLGQPRPRSSGSGSTRPRSASAACSSPSSPSASSASCSITSEYATGQIRATFGATPQRTHRPGRQGHHLRRRRPRHRVSSPRSAPSSSVRRSSPPRASTPRISDPGVLRAVIGGALYLTGVGLLGVGLGTILRRTAGAIAALVGAPRSSSRSSPASCPPRSRSRSASTSPPRPAWPSSTSSPTPRALSPWAGFAVLLAYGAAVPRRRRGPPRPPRRLKGHHHEPQHRHPTPGTTPIRDRRRSRRPGSSTPRGGSTASCTD